MNYLWLSAFDPKLLPNTNWYQWDCDGPVQCTVYTVHITQTLFGLKISAIIHVNQRELLLFIGFVNSKLDFQLNLIDLERFWQMWIHIFFEHDAFKKMKIFDIW